MTFIWGLGQSYQLFSLSETTEKPKGDCDLLSFTRGYKLRDRVIRNYRKAERRLWPLTFAAASTLAIFIRNYRKAERRLWPDNIRPQARRGNIANQKLQKSRKAIVTPILPVMTSNPPRHSSETTEKPKGDCDPYRRICKDTPATWLIRNYRKAERRLWPRYADWQLEYSGNSHQKLQKSRKAIVTI